MFAIIYKEKTTNFYEKQNKNNSWSWTITIFACLLFLSYTKFSTSGWFNQWYMVNTEKKKLWSAQNFGITDLMTLECLSKTQENLNEELN